MQQGYGYVYSFRSTNNCMYVGPGPWLSLRQS